MSVSKQVSGLNSKELLELEAQVAKAIEVRKASLIRSLDVLSKLGDGGDFKVPRRSSGQRNYKDVTYVNPQDRSATWNGRGRRPAWLIAIVDKAPTEKRQEVLAKLAA